MYMQVSLSILLYCCRKHQEVELQEKIAAISDLQSRLRINVESVQDLSQQVPVYTSSVA